MLSEPSVLATQRVSRTGGRAHEAPILGSCVRAQRSLRSQAEPFHVPKRARGIAVVALQGHSVALVDPIATDSRQATIVSYALAGHERVTAPPLTLVTSSRGAAAVGQKGQSTSAASSSTSSSGHQETVTLVCVGRIDGRAPCIKAFKTRFSGKALSHDRIVADVGGAWVTVETEQEVVQLVAIDADRVLAVDAQGGVQQLSLIAGQLSQLAPPAAAKAGRAAQTKGSVTRCVLLPPEMMRSKGPCLCTVSTGQATGAVNGGSAKGSQTRRITASIALLPLQLPDAKDAQQSLASGAVVMHELSVRSAGPVKDIGVHSSGTIQLLTEDRLHTARLQAGKSLRTSSITSASSLMGRDANAAAGWASVSVLNRSFSLLATISGSELEYALYDNALQLSLQTVKMPLLGVAQPAASGRDVAISTCRIGSESLLLGVSVDHGNHSAEHLVYAIKAQPPETSSVRAALETLSLATDPAVPSSDSTKLSSQDQALLDRLKGLFKARDVTGIDDAFVRWLTETTVSEPRPAVLMNAAFTSACASYGLQDGRIARKMMHALLERRVLSARHFQATTGTGLLAKIQASKDIGTLSLAVKSVFDLAEDDVIRALVSAADRPAGKDERELTVLVKSIAASDFNRARMRVALAQHVHSDGTRESLLAAIRDAMQQDHVLSAQTKSIAPPVDASFVSDCFDACVASAASTKSLLRLLSKWDRDVTAETALLGQLRSLQGPLNAYRQFESDKRRLRNEKRHHTNRATQAGAKRADAATQVGGGLRSQDTKLSRRALAAKTSAKAGPYTVDRILL